MCELTLVCEQWHVEMFVNAEIRRAWQDPVEKSAVWVDRHSMIGQIMRHPPPQIRGMRRQGRGRTVFILSCSENTVEA